MKYPKGTFFKNLQAATKFGDDEMVMDLIADQTTDIALSHPQALNAALENAGVKIDKANLDPKYLVGLVADNLQSNQKLIQNLSLMIADLNTPNKGEGDFLGDDSKDSKGGGEKMSGDAKAGLIGGIIGGVTSIFGTVGNIVQGDKIKKQEVKGKMFDYLQAKESAKAEIAKAEATGRAEIAKNKTMLTIGLGITLVVGIGVAIYLINKPSSPAAAAPAIAK